MWNSMKTFSTYVMSVSQYLRKNWKTWLVLCCQVHRSFDKSLIHLDYPGLGHLAPGLRQSLHWRGQGVRGGLLDAGPLLTLSSCMAWYSTHAPLPVIRTRLAGELKREDLCAKSFRNYANSERGTISLKFSNPISLKLNVILILNHLEQTRFTNPDKTL